MDVEKSIAFILDAQARFEASMQRLEASMQRLEASVQKHDEQIGALESKVATLADLVGRVAQAEIRLIERMDAGFQEVKTIQANTEYKLNALIDAVDKLVRRDGRQG